MDKLLILNYERFLSGFFPQTQGEDAVRISRLNAEIGGRLAKNDKLYEYSVFAEKHLQVRVVYNFQENSSIPSLVTETTTALEAAVKEAKFDDKNSFAVIGTRLVPLELYSAQIKKEAIESFFK